MAEPTHSTTSAGVQDADQHLPQVHDTRNPGMALDLDWVARVQANTSAIERRAAVCRGDAV